VITYSFVNSESDTACHVFFWETFPEQKSSALYQYSSISKRMASFGHLNAPVNSFSSVVVDCRFIVVESVVFIE